MSPKRSTAVCISYAYSNKQEEPILTVIPNITCTVKQQGTR